MKKLLRPRQKRSSRYLATIAFALSFFSTGANLWAEENNFQIIRQPFGKMPDGAAVDQFTFSNGRGLEVSVLTLGGILHTVSTPDKDGKSAVITLHHDSVETRLNDSWATGAIVGRFANRIANAIVTIDGREFRLEANAGKHQIHGGKAGGFQWQVWKAEPIKTNDAVGVKLHLTSPDGQGGFPGTVNVDVSYTINVRNELTMDYSATTDKPTFINLTNHAYWNLGGADTGDVGGHLLQIHADKFLEVDADLIPTGKWLDAKDSSADFLTARSIASRLAEVPKKHYDQCYVLPPAKAGEPMRLAARVVDLKSGRVMEVLTTQPGLQLFTGHPKGFCLETQHFPDSPHQPAFPSTLLRPGERFHEVTVHRFSVQR